MQDKGPTKSQPFLLKGSMSKDGGEGSSENTDQYLDSLESVCIGGTVDFEDSCSRI